MIPILAGQSSALDLLEATEAPGRPASPSFTVNLSVWQASGCGWCKKPNSIGGAAIRHPKHHGISIFYEYCEKCEAKYGDPRRSTAWPRFRVNENPGAESEKTPQILERITAYRTLKKVET